MDYWLNVWMSSVLTNTSSCDEEIKTCIGKGSSAFKMLDCIWQQESLGLPIKVSLYESIILAILLYSVETRTVTETDQQRSKAFQQTCLRRIVNKHGRTNKN